MHEAFKRHVGTHRPSLKIEEVATGEVGVFPSHITSHYITVNRITSHKNASHNSITFGARRPSLAIEDVATEEARPLTPRLLLEVYASYYTK